VSGLLPIANEGTKLARQFPPIKPGSVRGDALDLPGSGWASLGARFSRSSVSRFGNARKRKQKLTAFWSFQSARSRGSV